jgi:hypothetical protein
MTDTVMSADLDSIAAIDVHVDAELTGAGGVSL